MEEATPVICKLSHERREQLADEIGRLSSYLYAAEHRLLTLLREFDAGRGWEGLGHPKLTPVSRAVRSAIPKSGLKPLLPMLFGHRGWTASVGAASAAIRHGPRL